MMTFDCEDELEKVAAAFPAAQMLLRIRADDFTSELPFGDKFGVDAKQQAPALLQAAARLGVHVAGVAFHVGSASHSPAVFRYGISQARHAFDVALSYGLRLHVLDIGGGFWSRLDETGVDSIFDAGDAVNDALAEYFPAAAWPELQVIAEPGRYFAESCATHFALVHTVKRHLGGTWQYYLTDGAKRSCWHAFVLTIALRDTFGSRLSGFDHAHS